MRSKVGEIVKDLLADAVGCFLIATGVYNFAAASEFPVTGVSGIALVLYYLFKWPIGIVVLLLNIPIALVCWKVLGTRFMLRSFKTMLFSALYVDVIAPLLPVYKGDLMLSCICMGILSGVGYGLIYMRNTSTGGADFITMSIRAWKPHLSLGRIILIVDYTVLLICGILMGGNLDKIIYGLIASSIVATVVNKVMYGLDAGKVAFIVTGQGYKVAEKIYELTHRGATLLHGVGSHSKKDKHIVMCACSYKQMHMVQKAVKEVDGEAFLVIMEANQVRGQGFKPH